MNIEAIDIKIKSVTENLIQMTRYLCWNKISDNCFYILTNKEDIKLDNAEEIRKYRQKANRKKHPLTLNQVISKLKVDSPNLYDCDLYLYRSMKDKTIVEIQFLSGFALEKVNKEPMITCKIILPTYAENSKEKFNANWQFGGFQHCWKIFIWKLKIKRQINKNVC
ncbi:MAG: hypothetical protein JXB00_17520 [Bacteroidales bacterium]|nr:hypothetical protein [Bacteroidales bacterium]